MRTSWPLTLLCVGTLFAGLTLGCSGSLPDGGTGGDGGADGVGSTGQPCDDGRCDEAADQCVQQDIDGELVQSCRTRCPTDGGDPCGAGSTCRLLSNEDGVCLPANGDGEPCPCDDGLACVNYTPDAGPAISNTCKPVCLVDDPMCPEGTECRPFLEQANTGACL